MAYQIALIIGAVLCSDMQHGHGSRLDIGPTGSHARASSGVGAEACYPTRRTH